jgi:hypothetical protein
MSGSNLDITADYIVERVERHRSLCVLDGERLRHILDSDMVPLSRESKMAGENGVASPHRLKEAA